MFSVLQLQRLYAWLTMKSAWLMCHFFMLTGLLTTQNGFTGKLGEGKYGYVVPAKTKQLQFAFTTMALRAAFDGHELHLAQLSLTVGDLMKGRLVAPFPRHTWFRPSYPYSLIRLAPGPATAFAPARFAGWVADEARQKYSEMDAFLATAR